MIGLKVVDLFSKEELPEILAEEFNDVEGGSWAGFIAGESTCKNRVLAERSPC